jgi:hypothetical protein
MFVKVYEYKSMHCPVFPMHTKVVFCINPTFVCCPLLWLKVFLPCNLVSINNYL